MKKQDFKNISMTGRYAYILLCIEKLFVEKFPQKDFSKIFEFLWKGTEDANWDKMSEFVGDLSNDSLFESAIFDKDNFLVINEQDFKLYYNLLEDINDISNVCFSSLFDFLTVYENTSIPGLGKESIDSLFEIINLLKNHNVELPNIETISFSNFNERNGWGNHFDGSSLSIILNK